MHSRNLGVTDWFTRGGTIFDIDDDGCVLLREYGRGSKWHIIDQVKSKTTRFLQRRVVFERHSKIYRDLLLCYPSLNVEYRQRMPYGDDAMERKHQIASHCHQDAHFFSSKCNLSNGTRLKTLDDKNEPTNDATVGSNCFQLDERFDSIFEHYKKTGLGGQMMTIRKAATSSAMSKFKPHRDVGHFDTGVVFIPMAELFWTIIDGITDTNDDKSEFTGEWYKNCISDRERKQVDMLLTKFKGEFSVYKCVPGSSLAFRADKLVHATIIPKSFAPRQICILSKIVEAKSRSRKRKRS